MCYPLDLFLLLGPKLLWENIAPVKTVWRMCGRTVRLQTCHEAVPRRSRPKRMTLLHVAPRSLVFWNINVRVFILHCRRRNGMKAQVQSTGRQGCLGERCCCPHRSSSSGPSPPPLVCAASSSSRFQPPAIKTIPFICSTYKTFQMNCLQHDTHTHTSNLSCSILWYSSSWDSKKQRFLNFSTKMSYCFCRSSSIFSYSSMKAGLNGCRGATFSRKRPWEQTSILV